MGSVITNYGRLTGVGRGRGVYGKCRFDAGGLAVTIYADGDAVGGTRERHAEENVGVTNGGSFHSILPQAGTAMSWRNDPEEGGQYSP